MTVRRVRLGDVGQIFDGPHATPTRLARGPYFLNISSLDSGRLDLSKSDHVSLEDFTGWTRRVTPRGGDLLFSYETRLGMAALMPEGVQACLGRRMALFRPDKSQVDSRYILYKYLSRSFRHLIEQNAIRGATVDRIPLITMPDWIIDLPSLQIQQAIGQLLGALDDKITANREIISTVENLGETIFAHAQSRASREPLALGALLDLHYGQALPFAKRVPGAVPVYGSGGVVGSHNHAMIKRAGVVVGRKGSVGTVYWAQGPHWPIDTTYSIIPLNGYPIEYCYHLLRSMPLAKMSGDSAVPGLNRRHLLSQLVASLTLEKAESFAANSRPLFKLVAQKELEAARAAELRDSLLDPLMSGRLKIKDAERVVEKVI